MMSGNSHTDKNSNVADVSVLPVEGMAAAVAVDDMEQTSPPATRQQKLIKAGLLLTLVAIIIYVVLDYTVSILVGTVEPSLLLPIPTTAAACCCCC